MATAVVETPQQPDAETPVRQAAVSAASESHDFGEAVRPTRSTRASVAADPAMQLEATTSRAHETQPDEPSAPGEARRMFEEYVAQYADRGVDTNTTPVVAVFASPGISDARAAFERFVAEQDAKEAVRRGASEDDKPNDGSSYGTLGRALGMGPGLEDLSVMALVEGSLRNKHISPIQARAFAVKIGEMSEEGLEPIEIEARIKKNIESIMEARASFQIAEERYRTSKLHQPIRNADRHVEEDQGPSMDM
jgi:hypothetical protein